MRIVDSMVPAREVRLQVERILVPIDLKKCPLEAFGLINELIKGQGKISVILLHVVTLSIPVPENRIYEDLGWEAERDLRQLARTYLDPAATVTIHIRAGRPAQEILAEAEAENVDLLIFPRFGSNRWRRVTAFLTHRRLSRSTAATMGPKMEAARPVLFRSRS